MRIFEENKQRNQHSYFICDYKCFGPYKRRTITSSMKHNWFMRPKHSKCNIKLNIYFKQLMNEHSEMEKMGKSKIGEEDSASNTWSKEFYF